MKKGFLHFLLILAVFFTACNEENDNKSSDKLLSGNIAIISNYGMYNGGNGEFTMYNITKDSVIQDAYITYNGFEYNSKIQSMTLNDNKLYIVANSGDKIDIINTEDFLQNENPITGLQNPRFLVINDGFAYVSCWGETPDYAAMSDSYIAKINLKTKEITKIALAGGPEGLAISNNKLYAALNYKNEIAVMDLQTEEFSYIETPAVTSYFVADNNGNLYVTLVNTYSNPSDFEGLGFINTSDDSIETIQCSGVSSSYASILGKDALCENIYLISASYDANWNLVGNVQVYNIASKTFSTFVDNLNGINGLAVEPSTGNLYVLLAPSATSAGVVQIYDKKGEKIKEFSSNLSPNWVVFK